MAIFDFDEPDVGRKYLTLIWSLDGTQPCAEEPDKYIENWTQRPIPHDVAERLCAACPIKIKENCLDYALAAEEDIGIWGGTTPDQRKAMNNGED